MISALVQALGSVSQRVTATGLFGLVFAASTVAAQTAPVSATPSPSEAEIVLSPFVVNTERDSGYAPNETLSGTRLRTQTRDTATAITIMTSEMLKDLNVTSYADALDFLPSTSRYSTTESDANSNGPRTGQPMIIRGFVSNTQTRDFFTGYTPIDTYNTSRLTFSRGPNSILYGVGNPGGGIDATLNRAGLTRNSTELSLRADSFNGFRANLDENLVLQRNKLGLRVDLLHDDRGNNIKPAKALRDSQYLEGTWQPTGSTSITANFENNRLHNMIPRPFVAGDAYSQWVAVGKPIVAAAPVGTAAAKAQGGVSFYAPAGFTAYIPGIGGVNWAKQGYGSPYLVLGALTPQVSFSSPVIVPLDTNVAGSDSMNLDSKNGAVIVQQQLLPGLFLEVGTRYENVDRVNFEAIEPNAGNVYVDVNAQLPGGAPNPNVGRPYIVGTASTNATTRLTDQQSRATLSYDGNLPPVKILGRRLGRVTAAALYATDKTHERNDFYKEVNTTPLPGLNPQLDNAVNQIRRFTYLTPGGPTTFTQNYDTPIASNGVNSSFLDVSISPRNNVTTLHSWVGAMQAVLLDDLVSLTGGMRRDESIVAQRNFAKDARGVFESSNFGTPIADQKTIGRTYSLGAVVRLGSHLSAYANKATNFQPINQSSRDIYGNVASPMRGRGIDVGLKFFLFDEKLSGSVSYFESTQTGLVDNPIRAGNTNTRISAIWQAIDPSQDPGTLWTDFKNSRTTGYEFQMVGNPSKNLRLMLNASQGRTKLQSRGAVLGRYLSQYEPIWLAKGSLPAGTTVGDTVASLTNLINTKYTNDLAVVGGPQTLTYEWQVNAIARYSFDSILKMKGWAIGGAYRWRNAPVIGFQNLPGTLVNDITKPFRGAVTTNVDAWLEYQRKLWRGRVKWTLEFRVQNLLDDRDAVPWNAADDGSGHRFVITRLMPRDRQYILSSTFSL